MPTVLSKANFSQDTQRCNDSILNQLGVPLKCSSCSLSCDVCMISCSCERCVLRRRLEPHAVDKARIAIVQTQRKLAFQDRKKKKKTVYEALKSCIVKVTKKGCYKKAFQVGEGGDRIFCCKKAFDATYGINHTYVDTLVTYMKKKVTWLLLLQPTNHF